MNAATPQPVLLQSDIPVAQTTVQKKTVVAGVAAVPLVQGNPNRLSLTIVNLSADNIFIGFDAGVSAVNGILLIPNGGTYITTRQYDYALAIQPYFVLGAGAADNVLALEVLETVAPGT